MLFLFCQFPKWAQNLGVAELLLGKGSCNTPREQFNLQLIRQPYSYVAILSMSAGNIFDHYYIMQEYQTCIQLKMNGSTVIKFMEGFVHLLPVLSI